MPRSLLSILRKSLPYVVALERQRHAPRPAAPTNQLTPLECEHRALVLAHPLLAAQERCRRDDAEAAPFHLPQRRLVARIRGHEAGAHRDEVAPRRPLLALLHEPPVAAAEDGLER